MGTPNVKIYTDIQGEEVCVACECCVDCTDCRDCTDCTGCADCDGCDGCVGCSHLAGFAGVRHDVEAAYDSIGVEIATPILLLEADAATPLARIKVEGEGEGGTLNIQGLICAAAAYSERRISEHYTILATEAATQVTMLAMVDPRCGGKIISADAVEMAEASEGVYHVQRQAWQNRVAVDARWVPTVFSVDGGATWRCARPLGSDGPSIHDVDRVLVGFGWRPPTCIALRWSAEHGGKDDAIDLHTLDWGAIFTVAGLDVPDGADDPRVTIWAGSHSFDGWRSTSLSDRVPAMTPAAALELTAVYTVDPEIDGFLGAVPLPRHQNLSLLIKRAD